MRLPFAWLTAALVVASAREAWGQSSESTAPPPDDSAIAVLATPAPAPTTGEAELLERLHVETIETRRGLANAVLVAGLVSIAGGAALMIPDDDDQAWRFAGINTAIFGGVNTVVGLLARHGIAREEETWESDEARAARRTPAGLVRARIHAASDERRESVGHAINLGLNCAYLGIGGTAILASQLGVDHPNRWLASGVAIGIQAVFLIGIDFIGLRRSGQYHRKFLETFAPNVAIVPTSHGMTTQLGFGVRF